METNKEEVCKICGGTGTVSIDVDDGEGHLMSGVGEQTCLCISNNK